jgi:peroxiredoxin
MTDTEFAAYIDDLYAKTNGTDLPFASQHWTPEMLIEMFVVTTSDLDELFFDQAIAVAKAQYWRGKFAERQS